MLTSFNLVLKDLEVEISLTISYIINAQITCPKPGKPKNQELASTEITKYMYSTFI